MNSFAFFWLLIVEMNRYAFVFFCPLRVGWEWTAKIDIPIWELLECFSVAWEWEFSTKLTAFGSFWQLCVLMGENAYLTARNSDWPQICAHAFITLRTTFYPSLAPLNSEGKNDENALHSAAAAISKILLFISLHHLNSIF